MSSGYRNIEDIDDYEMVPLESMMQGFAQMNSRPNMDVNPNMGMDPNMGMNPNMSVDPNMGMDQFNNQGVFMNGSSPMGMPYGDVDMNDYEGLREQDMYVDRQPYGEGYNKFNPKHNDVNSIVRRVERYNPEIIRMLTRCGIPYRGAVGLIRRIVRLTLMYRDE